jgi:hypothetical protein
MRKFWKFRLGIEVVAYKTRVLRESKESFALSSEFYDKLNLLL